MKYKLVIFDFDGTLADSFPWVVRMLDTVADLHRFRRIAPHEIEMLRGANGRQIARRLGLPWWKLPFIARTMRRLSAENTSHIPLFDGVDGMLQRLSEAGVTLAVVTSNACSTVQQVLGPENAARIAHYECDVSLFGKHARFRRILKQTKLLPHEALCIGDELRDLEAANKAKIPFGAVAWGYTRIEALQASAPAEIFTRMEEISGRVLRNTDE